MIIYGKMEKICHDPRIPYPVHTEGLIYATP